MALVRQINSNQITNSNPLFSCATIIGDSVFIGTKENGLIVAALSSAGIFENITPLVLPEQYIFAKQLQLLCGRYMEIIQPIIIRIRWIVTESVNLMPMAG
jgi:hypothetical protein